MAAAKRRKSTIPSLATMQSWKLEDAKARFSEVVRLARTKGPQRVTYRGDDAVVVIAVEDMAKLMPRARPSGDLVSFLRSTGLARLDIERPRDRGREPQL